MLMRSVLPVPSPASDFPLAYYLGGNARKRMHPDTANLLEGWLRLLAEKGEKETFKRLKKIPNNLSYGTHPVVCSPEEVE